MIVRLARHGYVRSLTVAGEALGTSIGAVLSMADMPPRTSRTTPTSEWSQHLTDSDWARTNG